MALSGENFTQYDMLTGRRWETRNGAAGEVFGLLQASEIHERYALETIATNEAERRQPPCGFTVADRLVPFRTLIRIDGQCEMGLDVRRVQCNDALVHLSGFALTIQQV